MTPNSLRAAGLDSLLKQSTLPQNVKAAITGAFPSRESAERIMGNVVFLIRLLGAELELGGVESITIADEYHQAIASVDRGFKPPALTATNDPFGAAHAVAIPVLREGALKTCIVLRSDMAWALDDSNHELYSRSLHLLAHESAHAHDNEVRRRSFPEIGTRSRRDWKEENLYKIADKCWVEYIASRLSARWGIRTYCTELEQPLCETLSMAMERAVESIHGYRFHRNATLVEDEIRNSFGKILVRSSYLVGHVHGLGRTVSEMASQYHKLIQETAWFLPIFERYETNLKEMYGSFGGWSGREVFSLLIDTCEALLNAGGMQYIKQSTGDYSMKLGFGS